MITWPSQTSIPFEGLGKGRRVRMTEEDIELIRHRSLLVDLISSEYQDTLRLQLGPEAAGRGRLRASTRSFGVMRNVIPAAGGRFINPIDMEQRRRVAFLGNEIAETLFGSADPVGQMIRLTVRRSRSSA